VWRELGEEVLSRDYLAACEAASGIDLDGTLVDLAFWRLDDGCWNGPHAAETLKLLTHIIYLSPDWSYEQGGLLRILYSEDIDDVHHEVVPISGDSVMFTPGGENSWHAVTPVLHGSRKSVTVHLYDPAARDRPSYFDFPGAQ
jgi:Rps23 Pro-64 3,4-dihydroxylase Tpa1-like proline 4-hydroxylase